MNWIVASILIGLIFGILGNVAPNLFSIPGIVLVASFVTPIVSLVGYWRVTMPDPGRIGEEPQLNARVVARFGMVAGVVLGPSQHLIAQVAPQAAAIVGMGGPIVGLVTTFAIFVYARRLALRIPDDSLASQTRTVMWGIAFSSGLVVIMSVLLVVSLSRLGVGGAGGVVVVACIGAVIMLIFAIWSLILVFRYRRAMLNAAAEARTTWARAA